MKHPFPVGTKVVTNKAYNKRFGRKVTGVSVGAAVPEDITLVRWESQEGNEISEYQGQNVIMMSKDLEVVEKEDVAIQILKKNIKLKTELMESFFGDDKYTERQKYIAANLLSEEIIEIQKAINILHNHQKAMQWEDN